MRLELEELERESVVVRASMDAWFQKEEEAAAQDFADVRDGGGGRS